MLPIGLWPVLARTGWGSYAIGLALGLARAGRTVILPPSDFTDVPKTVLPLLNQMVVNGQTRDEREQRIALQPYGLHWPPFIDIPNRTQVLLYMAEDTTVPDQAIAEVKKYPMVLAPSRWAQNILRGYGVESMLYWQGYNESAFTSSPRLRPQNGPAYVFIGGKLEFRKGIDIAIAAFRQFRETPEGKDAIMVTAINNLWPQTMVSIYESGYVKGVPVMRNGTQDIPAWLEVNGIPRSANIDLGLCSQLEMAAAIRECDLAIFPNRCECATNMLIPEVMGCGVPCIIGNWTGQADVVSEGLGTPLFHSTPVTLPCPIYKGYEGWGEANVDELVASMIAMRQTPAQDVIRGPLLGIQARATFGWSTRANALHQLLLGLE